jgi:hypothetical protein
MARKIDSALLVDAWKQTIEVQKHFNDLSWRIRGFGITVLTFTFGATFLAYSATGAVILFSGARSPAAFIPMVGLILWLAIAFTDALWYHRLLVGAVNEGVRLERALQALNVDVRLTQAIGESSPIWNWIPRGHGKKGLHSQDKLTVFYLLGAASLVVTAATLLFWIPPMPAELGPTLPQLD